MGNGKIHIISFHNDDQFIQLTYDTAWVWQHIDGKRNWKKILDLFSDHTNILSRKLNQTTKSPPKYSKNDDLKIENPTHKKDMDSGYLNYRNRPRCY